MLNKTPNFTTCPKCQGSGKKRRRISKKVQLDYQNAVIQFENTNAVGVAPKLPKGQLYACESCLGSGLITAVKPPVTDTESFPHVAIIGGGIGGVALAVACLQRGIPFTIYERDRSFDERSQGYGLTLQQASKALKGFGISALTGGVISTRHLVHTTDGKIIGEWGNRKWVKPEEKATPKRTNIHIARQALRLALLAELGGENNVQWGHQLIDFKKNADETIQLNFLVNGNLKCTKADLVVGTDGIRSTVRSLLIGDKKTRLCYLGCMVILGICPMVALEGMESSLLDAATVFQTANGNERIYIMPFTKDSVMWQLSFPMPEEEAIALSAKGAESLKNEARERTNWHSPVPQIVEATLAAQISGYPVYDRAILEPQLLEKAGQVTLLGDAAHPMSPFKGQGANQALLDALSLARGIYKRCKPQFNWKEIGLRKTVLTAFEAEMISRTTPKVKGSATAAKLLHSVEVLKEGDSPRGRLPKNEL